MLRVTERSAHVGHVPDVLYAWRMVPGSTAVSAGFKPLAQDAGRRAVEDALRRRDLDGRVDLGTGRSSIGKSGFPVVRSKRYRKPCLVV